MFSKSIKISTFIITTALYGFLAYLFFFSNQVPDLALLLKWLDDTNAISDTTQIIFSCFVLFGPVLALLFTFIMRAIDWRREKHEGGYIWVLGLVLSFIFFFIFQFGVQITDSESTTATFFAFDLIVEYIVCLLAIFINQNDNPGESDYLRKIRHYDDPENWGCM